MPSTLPRIFHLLLGLTQPLGKLSHLDKKKGKSLLRQTSFLPTLFGGPGQLSTSPKPFAVSFSSSNEFEAHPVKVLFLQADLRPMEFNWGLCRRQVTLQWRETTAASLTLEKGEREGERERGSEEGTTGVPPITILCAKQYGGRGTRAVQIQWLENILVIPGKRKRFRRKNWKIWGNAFLCQTRHCACQGGI